jgi:hypothetical protein
MPRSMRRSRRFTRRVSPATAGRASCAVHEQGVAVSHERVRNSLKRQDLRPVYKRPYRVTTDSAHPKPIAPNVLDRASMAGKSTKPGLPTSPISRRAKAGCIWPASWTWPAAESWGGR